MKRTLFVGLVISALFTAAPFGVTRAADMPVKAAAPPPPAPVYSWTGFYVSGGVGYGTWAADTTIINAGIAFLPTGACAVCVPMREGGKGWLGTVGTGFDYQFSDHIVAGVLADWNFSDIKGSIVDPTAPVTGSTGNLTEHWSWAAGGRIGWLITPAILSYVNGGYTQTHFGSASLQPIGFPRPLGFATPAFSEGGWFLGGGMEASLSNILPGLFTRLEYRYAYYGTTTLTDICPSPAGILVCPGSAIVNQLNSINFHPSVQTISTELVYKFNWVR